MPTIYTEDTVAKAAEEMRIGEQGVFTGNPANSIGYNNYKARTSPTYGPINSGGSSSYQMLPFNQTILDAIPRWAYLLFAITGAATAFFLIPNASTSEGGVYGVAVIGALIGGFIVQLAIFLVDLVIQIAWILLKVALFLGVFAGIIWGLSALLR